MRNLFRLKKTTTTIDTAIKGIRNLFRLEKKMAKLKAEYLEILEKID